MIVGRIVNRLVWYVDRLLSRVYHARHPGPIGRRLIAAAAPLTGLCQPNDKWNLHVHAPRWMEGVSSAPPAGPLPQPKSIFLFCAYRAVYTTHLVLAVLLVWRGHKVTIGYLPKLQSPNKPPLKDHPSAKPYLHSIMSRIAGLTGGRITCVDLSENMSSAPIDSEAARSQARYDTMMAYQKEDLDLADPVVRGLFDHYVEAGERAQVAIRNHLKDNRYDIYLVGNGCTFEGSHACRIFKEAGYPVNTFEKFAFRGVRVINHGDHFLNGDDIDVIWNRRDELGYGREPYWSTFRQRAEESLRERSRGSTSTWLWELQQAGQQSAEAAFETAGLNENSEFVLICPNVPFDAGYEKITDVFASMKEWIFATVKYLLEETNQIVVVRCHPSEYVWWGGKEPVSQLLADAGFKASERLVIIPGKAKVNTYRLMERCRFGVVFSSSTGLEMAMLGKHVVVGSNVIYSRRGFTHDARSREAYFQNLLTLANANNLGSIDKSQQELATLFYFVYHWVAQYPYPFDKPSSLVRRAPKDVLRSAEMVDYLPYLDLLSMDKNEFAQALPQYLSASKIMERLKRAA